MKISLRHIIGILIITIGLALKTTLNHNVEYWGTIKSFTILIFIVGITTLSVNILFKLDKKPSESFWNVPKQWILRGFKILCALAIVLLITISLEKIGEITNERIKDYFLSSNTKQTVGTVIEKRRISYIAKSTHYQEFYIIEYYANNERIRQGIKSDGRKTENQIKSKAINAGENRKNLQVNILNGLKFQLIYSEKHPTFFKIKE